MDLKKQRRSPEVQLPPRSQSSLRLKLNEVKSQKQLRSTLLLTSVDRKKSPAPRLYSPNQFSKCAAFKGAKPVRTKPRPQTKVINLQQDVVKRPPVPTKRLKLDRSSLANESSLIRAISLLTPPADMPRKKLSIPVKKQGKKKKKALQSQPINQTLDESDCLKPFLTEMYSSSDEDMEKRVSDLNYLNTEGKSTLMYEEQRTPEFGLIEKENERPSSSQPRGPPSSFYPGPYTSYKPGDEFPSSPFSSSDRNPMITPTYTTVNTSPIKDAFELESPELNQILIQEEFMAHQPVYPSRPQKCSQSDLKTTLFCKILAGVVRKKEGIILSQCFFQLKMSALASDLLWRVLRDFSRQQHKK